MCKFLKILYIGLLYFILSAYIITGYDEDFYIKVLKYGTDLDITHYFPKVKENLGERVNQMVLTVFFQKHSERVYQVLAEYIGIAKFEEGKSLLIQELKKTGLGEDYVEKIIYSIGKFKDPQTIPHLLDILKNNRTSIRIKQAVVNAMGEIGSKNIEDELISLVKNENENLDIRAQTILALGKLGGGKSLSLLKEILLNTYEPKLLRMYSAYSLGRIGKENVLEILSRVIDDPYHEVAEYAVSAISEVGTKKCGPYLISALRSDYDRVRFIAASGLASIKYEDAIEILEFKANFDSNEKVRAEARRAIEVIKGAKEKYKKEE